jgi:hypothetical protein
MSGLDATGGSVKSVPTDPRMERRAQPFRHRLRKSDAGWLRKWLWKPWKEKPLPPFPQPLLLTKVKPKTRSFTQKI